MVSISEVISTCYVLRFNGIFSIFADGLKHCRVFCNKIVNHSYFTNSVLICILVSSAMLAAEDPLEAQSPRNTVIALIFI